MFGWNKSSEESRDSGTKPFNLEDLGINIYGDVFELPPEAEDLNEEDLNDPTLLVSAVPVIDIDALGALGAPNDDDDVEVELDEEDMKDPTLLSELRELGYQSDGENDGAAVKHEESTPVTNTRKQQLKSKMEGRDQPVSVVTDNDKGDSQQKGDTSKIGQSDSAVVNYDVKGVSHSPVQPQSNTMIIDHSASVAADNNKGVSRSQAQSNHDTRTIDLPLDVMLLEENVEMLAKYIQQEKLKAVTKNRAGDKAGAVESMRAYKQLEAKRDQILKNESSTSSEISQNNIQLKPSSTSKPATENAALSQETDSSKNSELILSIKQRLDQYMAAVNMLKNTNYQRAKEYMNTAKNLQAMMQSLLSGGQLPEGWVLPREPDMTEKAQSPAPSTSKKKVTANVTPTQTPKQKVLTAIDTTKLQLLNDDEKPLTMMSREDQYARLLAQLESQISLCTTISAYYLKSGDKSQASFFYKYKKSFTADLESLTSYQKHGKDVPPFRYMEVTYNVENAFFDLSANDLEVCIERAWNMGNKEVNGKDVEAYVNFDIGWPPEGSPGAGSGKGDTSVAKRGMDPEFNWKKTLNIERNKAFQRHIDRKKALFEVFHYRGFFRKAISLGKAQVKLDPLISKSEIHEVVELVDNNRKPTGGKLEIRLRMRTPLLRADVITKTERWLIIDNFNTNHPSQLTSRPAASTSVKTPSNTDPTSTSLKTPVNPGTSEPSIPAVQKTSANELSEEPSQASTSVTQKPSTSRTPATLTKNAQSTETEQSELEQAEEQLNDVDLIVSTKLLQQESEMIDAEIATLQAQQKPVSDDLTDRKSAIQIKMTMMEMQVQTGQLTIDKYMEQVRASTANYKKLALVFKKAGKLEVAKKALVRSKTMEGELKEMEEAMAGGAMNNE
ncbi:17383_t:CDS:2 [Acaulospora colombiana]|uniref:17383_t:CDS:1 n=1 Tax=Acaulospora colombiana TaxID=27376 RepID=A0ACA9LH40_9GLOM|nr:17383_t:CDS:2 [Acaulospora colombiana]